MKNKETAFRELDFLKSSIEEECRLNLVKAIVDCACSLIQYRQLSSGELEIIRPWVKDKVMTFLPGQESRYDMIYDSRLKRYMEQYSGGN